MAPCPASMLPNARASTTSVASSCVTLPPGRGSHRRLLVGELQARVILPHGRPAVRSVWPAGRGHLCCEYQPVRPLSLPYKPRQHTHMQLSSARGPRCVRADPILYWPAWDVTTFSPIISTLILPHGMCVDVWTVDYDVDDTLCEGLWFPTCVSILAVTLIT